MFSIPALDDALGVVCDPSSRYPNSVFMSFLAWIGHVVYWLQQTLHLPDGIGLVVPPYLPTAHLFQALLLFTTLLASLVVSPLLDWLLGLDRPRAIWRRNMLATAQHLGYVLLYTTLWSTVIGVYLGLSSGVLFDMPIFDPVLYQCVQQHRN